MSNQIVSMFLVGGGGFVGAIMRYYISTRISKSFPSALPYGTLTVNLTGSFTLGLLIGNGISDSLSLLIGTGFIGAFTTFSTLQIESLRMMLTGKYIHLFVYNALTYILGLILAFIGYMIVH
jgi:CrcB protein